MKKKDISRGGGGGMDLYYDVTQNFSNILIIFIDKEEVPASLSPQTSISF